MSGRTPALVALLACSAATIGCATVARAPLTGRWSAIAAGGSETVRFTSARARRVAALTVTLRAPPELQLTLEVTSSDGAVRRYPTRSALAPAAADGIRQLAIDFPEPIDVSSLGVTVSAGSAGAAAGSFELRALATDRAPVPVTIDPFAVDGVAAAGGDFLARLGVCIHNPDDPAPLAKARAAGFHWVRIDLFWPHVESTRGHYDFSRYDALVAAAERLGLSVLFILDYDNPLYADAAHAAPRTPAAVAAFAAYAAAAATHFVARPVAFEVWNEPNIGFWQPAPDAAAFAALARATIARIHAVAPATRVATGGLAGFDARYLSAMLAAGAASGADAVAVHPYRNGAPEESGFDEALFARLLEEAHVHAPLWNSEVGHSSASPRNATSGRDRQAKLVARELLTARALGYALTFDYDLVDDGARPDEREDNFGLLTHDGGEKPAYRAVVALTAAARGRPAATILRTPLARLYALRFDGDDDCAVALWTSSGAASVQLARAPIRAFDYLGRAVAVDPSATPRVRVGDAPLYLVFARPLSPREPHARADLRTGKPQPAAAR